MELQKPTMWDGISTETSPSFPTFFLHMQGKPDKADRVLAAQARHYFDLGRYQVCVCVCLRVSVLCADD